MNFLLQLAQSNLNDVLKVVFQYSPGHPVLLVYDQQCFLSRLLTEAYQQLLPELISVNFDEVSPEKVLEKMNQLLPETLVILVQTSSFRLNEFRIRVELFKRNLKVIEMPHLGRVNENEAETYLHSLAYDPDYYRLLGPKLKTKIDSAESVRLIGVESELLYDSRFEEAKLNIGDYRQMKNWGGQFPIGEVFSEPQNLEAVNGVVEIFAFGNVDYTVSFVEEPILLKVEKGVVVDFQSSSSGFKKVFEKIQEEEKKVWIRELGFGLNRAFTRENRVSDAGSYERMCGIHLSLGSKHAMYTKAGFPKKKTKYHVDVFAVVDRVEIDQETVFENGKYFTGS